MSTPLSTDPELSRGTGHATDLHHRGYFVVVFVVFMGVGVSMLNVAAAPWTFYLQTLGVAAVYVALFVTVGDRFSRGSLGGALAAYFVGQIALGGAVSALFARQGVFAIHWLIFMPLVAQSRMLLRTPGTAVVCLGTLAVLAAHVHFLSGWRQVPGVLGGVSTAIAFVLLFTDIAMREASARGESQRLSEELAAANRRLADYAVQAEELATIRERERVAREIHDSVGHFLSALNMQLEAARATFERDPETSIDALDKAQGLARQGLSEIRRSVAALRSSPLDGRRLDDALALLVDQNVEAGLPARLRVEGPSRPLGSRADLTLYRTVQEGLTNARKHSRANRVEVVLDYRSAERIRLEVHDDGVGSDDTRGGFGLLGVRERVRQVDGQLEVSTRQGHGLTLEVEIPA